jgi:hypothetical protein
MNNNLLIDATVAAGLVLALVVVMGLDKLLPAPTPEQNQKFTTKSASLRPMRLAVTPTQNDEKTGKWDDMGKLLNTLGEGYRFEMFPLADLFDAKKLAEYDVLFLTCAPGGKEPAVTENLRNFVGKGGTLYASDWRYDCVALAFPEFRAPGLEGKGKAANKVVAEVLDAGLRDQLGPTVDLKFNLSKWKTAAFAGDRVTTLLRGRYESEMGGTRTAPFLVKFPFGKGMVIFTSFHNERQNSQVELKLLKYLVFSAVTAKLEAEVGQTLVQGGFSPQKSNLLSASPQDQEFTQTYRAKKAGPIRFVLGFENRGARLRLTVISPDNKKWVKEDDSTVTIEQAGEAGREWCYTVTAVRVPYPDFPFTLTVGEK